LAEKRFQAASKYQKHSKKQKAPKQAIKEASKKAKLDKVLFQKLNENLEKESDRFFMMLVGSIQPQIYNRHTKRSS
jgi:hypothetical protein